MGVSISTVWYNIKVKKLFKNVYLAECGRCIMLDKNEVMQVVKQIDAKNQRRLDKKDEILNKVKE
jgi:hypothetical protein